MIYQVIHIFNQFIYLLLSSELCRSTEALFHLFITAAEVFKTQTTVYLQYIFRPRGVETVNTEYNSNHQHEKLIYCDCRSQEQHRNW